MSFKDFCGGIALVCVLLVIGSAGAYEAGSISGLQCLMQAVPLGLAAAAAGVGAQ